MTARRRERRNRCALELLRSTVKFRRRGTCHNHKRVHFHCEWNMPEHFNPPLWYGGEWKPSLPVTDFTSPTLSAPGVVFLDSPPLEVPSGYVLNTIEVTCSPL